MKIKLEGLELIDLQNVRRKPGIRISISKDLITYGLVTNEGHGYRLTDAGVQVLKLSSPALQLGQNMKAVLGFKPTPKYKK